MSRHRTERLNTIQEQILTDITGSAIWDQGLPRSRLAIDFVKMFHLSKERVQNRGSLNHGALAKVVRSMWIVGLSVIDVPTIIEVLFWTKNRKRPWCSWRFPQRLSDVSGVISMALPMFLIQGQRSAPAWGDTGFLVYDFSTKTLMIKTKAHSVHLIFANC